MEEKKKQITDRQELIYQILEWHVSQPMAAWGWRNVAIPRKLFDILVPPHTLPRPLVVTLPLDIRVHCMTGFGSEETPFSDEQHFMFTGIEEL